jgi:hypothetical protein
MDTPPLLLHPGPQFLRKEFVGAAFSLFLFFFSHDISAQDASPPGLSPYDILATSSYMCACAHEMVVVYFGISMCSVEKGKHIT